MNKKLFMKTFESFNSNGDTENEYIRLEFKPYGLKIYLLPEGKEYIDENRSDDRYIDDIFYDLFESIMVNSELRYFDNIGNIGLGMSEAPCITDRYGYNDDGEFEAYSETANVYYYEPYAIRSFVEELYETGETYFHLA